MDSKNLQNQQSGINLPTSLANRWTQKTLSRQEGNSKQLLISRSYVSVTSTIFMIIASLLPYLDLFLNPLIDTNSIKMNRFPSLSVAIWSYAICISPPLILLASKFKPYRFAYIVPCYVYTTMFCGFFFLECNINIQSDLVFRIITLFLSLILLFLSHWLIRLCRVVKFKEDVMDEMIKLKK